MKPWYAMLVFLLIITSVVSGVQYYLYARLVRALAPEQLSLIHISEPSRPYYISYADFCLTTNKNK